MSNDRVQIDEAALKKSALTFLRSPAAERIYEEFDTPWWLCLIGAVILLVAGVLMLPTIIWTVAGLRAIWSVVRLEQFSVLSKNPRKNPESLRVLICHGITIGPDQRHALVLGDFRSSSEYSVDWLARKAAFLGKLYREGPSRPEDESLYSLLRDDTYRPYRRRRVPEPHAEGTELFLFDVELDVSEGRTTPFETILFAFVATPGEKGEIMQVPWDVANDAVHMKS